MADQFIKYKKGIFEPYISDVSMEHWSDTSKNRKWTVPFPDLMNGLGFEMDCGKSFQEAYPGVRCFDISNSVNRELIKNCLVKSDAHIVGNYLFSLFRYYTHWNDTDEPLKSEEREFIRNLLNILDGKLDGNLFLDDIPIDEKAICLSGDYASNVSLEDMQHMADSAKSEKEIAAAFAVADNKATIVDDETYDYEEGTMEHEKACEISDAWLLIYIKLRDQIFEILRSEGCEIPITHQIEVLSIFMERNGFENTGGWWIKKNNMKAD